MKNTLYVIECICISVAVFGICIIDSNCIVSAVLILSFGSGLAICIRIEEWLYGSSYAEDSDEELQMLRKPTREQRKRMKAAGFDWKQFLILESDDISMTAIHKPTGKRSVIIC